MSIVDFNSKTWSDPWFSTLPIEAKLLFIYLWTNDHKNIAGLYPLALRNIAFETGFSEDQARDGLKRLEPKVKYDYEKEIVWVANHARHQFMRTPKISPKVKVGIEKSLISLNNHHFAEEFAAKYPDLLPEPEQCPI